MLTGFGEIHLIYLDTIDLSNLNRQFLFRHEHIKKPKALVAKEVAQKFNPRVKLEAHHANIKDPHFNIDWFSSFNLVFNALDNLDARRHVNKMCLAAGVPLIESGTTGFNGQVQVIIKGKTACYDCNPKATPKTFPVCTIRSTPTQSIHCIVWAKSYLLPELFGVSEEEVPEMDQREDSENAEEIENLRQEAQILKKIRESMGLADFSQKVFDKVFNQDIDRLRNMEDMWKLRKPPEPISYENALAESEVIDSTISQNDQQVWTRAESCKVFFDSLDQLSKQLVDEQSGALKSGSEQSTIAFDKDDDLTLNFVAAASNIRSEVFGIEPKSKFDIKQMAGNIIPAIATTNAMIAGLCVIQAFKVLRGQFEKTKMAFVNRSQISAGLSEAPNPDCSVCGTVLARAKVDAEKATLKDLVEGILKEELGYSDDVEVYQGTNLVFDVDVEDNLSKKLGELGIGDGSFLVVKDESEPQDGEMPRVDLELVIEAQSEHTEASKAIALLSRPEIPRRAKRKPPELNGTTILNGESATNGNQPTFSSGAKRKRDAAEAELDEGGMVKKAQTGKTLPSDEQGTILLDEVEEGAITIED